MITNRSNCSVVLSTNLASRKKIHSYQAETKENVICTTVIKLGNSNNILMWAIFVVH